MQKLAQRPSSKASEVPSKGVALDLGKAANVSRWELDKASLANARLTGARCHCHGDSTCHAVSNVSRCVKSCQASYYMLHHVTTCYCVFKGFQMEKTPLFRVRSTYFQVAVAPASGEVSRLEKLNLGQIQGGNMQKAVETICKRSLAKPPRPESEWLAHPALISCLVCMSTVMSFGRVLGISLIFQKLDGQSQRREFHLR